LRTIAVINQKGGCGKTTLSINLAAVLAGKGQKTLLVDMDPQAHCALGLAVPEAQLDHTISDLLRAGLDGSLQFSDIVWQISKHLDLAPSTMALAGIEQELSTTPDKDRRLSQVLNTVADQYDFCIIDCPPSIGLLTFNALLAANEVLVPVETGYFAMQGAVKQQATIEMLAHRVSHRVKYRVLATMYDVRTKLAREILAELRRHFGDKLLPIVVHFNSKLKEAASFGQPITEFDPASRGMEDFGKLAAWLLDNPTEPAQALAETPQASNPAMNRAAELVERARALNDRTANLSDKLANDPDIATEETLQIKSKSTPNANLTDKLAKLYGVRNTSQGVLFVHPANAATEQASVAGDFNNWSSTATPMNRDEKLGIFQTCVPLQPGTYRYRLVIDGKWINDPYNSYVESNPYGELNNVIEADTK